jgi:hypothetical protein
MPKTLEFPNDLYIASKSSCSSYDFTTVGTDKTYREFLREIVQGVVRAYGTNPSKLINLDQGQDLNLDEKEREFRRQKELFLAIEPLFLAPYEGQYVISRNGVIVDHDTDLPTLTQRFVRQHGYVPIYISRIGKPMELIIDTPFFD